MDVTEFLTGNYLTAAEIKIPTNVTIKDAKRELVGQGQNQQTKLVVHFNELAKGLVANKTNLGVIANLFGTNSDAWKGQPLQLYSEMVSFQGRQVPGLRVRAVPQPPAPPSNGQPQPAVLQAIGRGLHHQHVISRVDVIPVNAVEFRLATDTVRGAKSVRHGGTRVPNPV